MFNINITDEHLEGLVQVEEYHQVPNTTITICALHLASGQYVTGESAVQRPTDFDPVRGKEIARAKAMKRLADLVAFHLYEVKYEQQLRDDRVDVPV